MGLENCGKCPLSRPLVVRGPTPPTPPKGALTRDETETPTDLEPEDLLSGPLVDVPDAVRGDLRERSGGGGGGECPKRPHGDDLGSRRQGGYHFGLVPPGRIGPTDARRGAGAPPARSPARARRRAHRPLVAAC